MAASPKNITIMGAGLVGSLLSIYLAKRGHQVDVYERRPDMRKTGAAAGRSINLALSERGWKALAGAGVDSAVKHMGIPMYGRMIHHEDHSQSYQPYGKEGQAIYSVSRGGLNQVLLYEAERAGVSIHFGNGCDEADFEQQTVRLQDGTQLQPDIVFGADGAFSRLRLSMMKTDRFDYQQQYLTHGYKELTIPPAEDGGWLIEKNALHIWPRHEFMLIALPNQDGSFTCTLFAPYDGENGLNRIKDKYDLMRYFTTHFPDLIPLIPNLTEDYFGNPTASLVTVRCYPWVKGNMALIGDSAHAIVPFYGQGMNAGFEDCHVLAGIMDAYGDDWDTILHTYEQQRKPCGDGIADLALYNFIEMRDKVDDAAFLYRKKVEKLLHAHHPADYVPLYTQVTFSDIPYDKALEAGRRQDRFFEKVLPQLDMQAEPDEALADRLIAEWRNFQ